MQSCAEPLDLIWRHVLTQMAKARTEVARFAPPDPHSPPATGPIPNEMPQVPLVALPFARARAAAREFMPFKRRSRSRGRRRRPSSGAVVRPHAQTVLQTEHISALFGSVVTQECYLTPRATWLPPADAAGPPLPPTPDAPSHTTTPSPRRSLGSMLPPEHTAELTISYAAASAPPCVAPEPRDHSKRTDQQQSHSTELSPQSPPLLITYC